MQSVAPDATMLATGLHSASQRRPATPERRLEVRCIADGRRPPDRIAEGVGERRVELGEDRKTDRWLLQVSSPYDNVCSFCNRGPVSSNFAFNQNICFTFIITETYQENRMAFAMSGKASVVVNQN